jgi:hypothetical protein
VSTRRALHFELRISGLACSISKHVGDWEDQFGPLPKNCHEKKTPGENAGDVGGVGDVTF